jgi:quinol monooxygenase YgiN
LIFEGDHGLLSREVTQSPVSCIQVGASDFHPNRKVLPMAKVQLALIAKLEAKPGKEAEVESFLKGALPLVQAETGTIAWFAIRMGYSSFGIFDVFNDETGRQAHLTGKVAAALMAKASELLAKPPEIQKWDVLEAKLKE